MKDLSIPNAKKKVMAGEMFVLKKKRKESIERGKFGQCKGNSTVSVIIDHS
jgi:hypothetical protein